MSDLKHWSWTACDAVNRMFDCDASLEEVHYAIQRVRQFLEARASQSAPPWTPNEQAAPAEDFSDLLGVN